MKKLRAFTLLETLLALAILGVSLLAVININQQAVVSHLYAKRLTIATMLARSKMIDLEQQMHDKGLSVDDDEDSGDFSDEGFSSYKWRARIIAPKTNGLSPQQLFSALFNLPMGDGKDGDGLGGIMSSLFGAGGDKKDGKTPSLPGMGGLPGAAAGAAGGAGMAGMLGPLAGVAQAQFTQMVEQLQKAVREVHLTVTWKEGKMTESIDLVTHVVSLGPGSDRNGGGTAPGGGQDLGGTWVRADNGQPVPNAVPAPNGSGMIDPRDGSPAITAAQWQQRMGGVPGMPTGVPRPQNMQGQLR